MKNETTVTTSAQDIPEQIVTKQIITKSLPFIPNRGKGTLPVCDARTHPNLVTIYLDAQYDHRAGRLYLLAARVAAAEDGGKEAGGRAAARNLVWLAQEPPSAAQAEADLLTEFAQALLRAIAEKAVPDEAGLPSAPLHLVLWDEFAWRTLLDGLARHQEAVLAAAPALYDLLTQKAAFASPCVTFLSHDIRRKNLPLVCPSLTNVASLLGHDWTGRGDEDLRRVFRSRLFDGVRVLRDAGSDMDGSFYTARARFDSQIPLEYAYAAWDALPQPTEDAAGKKGADPFAAFREATPDLLRELMRSRVIALSHVTGKLLSEKFRGNPKIVKSSFNLSGLPTFRDRADTLAQALGEFVYIERHVELADWKAKRLAPPEQRCLAGDCLLVTYREADQREEASDEGETDAEQAQRNLDQRSPAAGTLLRLRLCPPAGMDAGYALALSGIQPGDRLILAPRWADNHWTGDNGGGNTLMSLSADQLLYQTRVEVVRVGGVRDMAAQSAFVLVRVVPNWGGDGIFLFPSAAPLTVQDDGVYTLDPDPNSPLGKWQSDLMDDLVQLEQDYREQGEAEDTAGSHVLLDRLSGTDAADELHADARDHWEENAQAGQMRFLHGLDALARAGLLPELLSAGLEDAKRDLIGKRSEESLLLVQGPPGTGKTTATALAVLARVQGAILANLPLRVALSCKTHAATDVLLNKVLDVQEKLAGIRDRHPALFARYFDARLLSLPLLRLAPKAEPPLGVLRLDKAENKYRVRRLCNWDTFRVYDRCILAGTPGGICGMVKGRWGKEEMLEHKLVDLLVLDEASQMGLPDALLSALPLRPTGQVLVVGDPRQMPPIVKHEWDTEPRRTFQDYAAFQSLYEFARSKGVPQIKFERSFRVHRDVAEFLRREVYQKDGIAYFSANDQRLPEVYHVDPFVAAVLDPDQPLVVVVHDEDSSQTVNPFEQELLAPLLDALADPLRYGLDAEKGLGVVVPHRAQRAAFKRRFPGLVDAIDTPERYQGGERDVIVLSATESDPAYLAEAGEFLLNPQRMTVALSRARKKLIVVAARSVFSVRSLDDDLFEAAQLWKSLLRRACTERLWQGQHDGHGVTVWGKPAAQGENKNG